jgi:glycosyltransferase involved in cell wall biosynthesis
VRLLQGEPSVLKAPAERVQDGDTTTAESMRISVVILTFNSELTIAKTLECARCVSDDIHVVDSYSKDRTLQIAESYGARIVQHPFLHYGDQRNWAIDNLSFQYGWQLHLDADEFLSPALIAAIEALKKSHADGGDGFYLPRLTRFLGREIRHGGHYPTWHLRLFRNGAGRCEARKYDQHFILSGTARRIHAPMIDDNRMSLREWTERHNRWSDAEVEEILHPTQHGVIEGKLRGGTPMQMKRALRKIFLRVPLFARSLVFFVYRYFLLLGFLDGRPGLIYNVLQTFWYRFLIEAKLYERSLAGEKQRVP